MPRLAASPCTKRNRRRAFFLSWLTIIPQRISREDAKKQVVDGIIDDARKDAGNIVRDIENEAREEGEKKARNLSLNSREGIKRKVFIVC